MRTDVFAAVMATGIVSVAAADHGLEAVSALLAALAVVALPVLVCLVAARWRHEGWTLGDVDTAVGLFTYVAACTVLAARFADHRWVVEVLGALALSGWTSLTPNLFRAMRRLRWVGVRDRAHGGWELASVATSGLAMTSATLDAMFWALILWAVALLLYVVMTGLVCWRLAVDARLRRDVPPDDWILMGGLAIATLAGDHIHRRLAAGPLADVVHDATVVTWVLATLWLVPLAVVGWRRIRDWPAVFPLGMYSSATYATAGQTGWHLLVEVSLVFCWIALTVWLLTVIRWRTISRRAPAADTP